MRIKRSKEEISKFNEKLKELNDQKLSFLKIAKETNTSKELVRYYMNKLGIKNLYVKNKTGRPINISYNSNENGCLVCNSHKPDKDGYIRIRRDNKKYLLHRKIYEEKYGKIPEKLVVRHKCDIPNCINIEHLELGTIGDNNRDRKERGRSAKGEKGGNTKLKEFQVIEILSSNLSCKKLSKIYSVSKSTIEIIKSRKTWKHLNNP